LRGDRLSTLVSFEALKLAAGVVLLSPNIPFLFMGEEYGEKSPFQYFVNHSDPELIEAVRRGREEEFSAFRWEGNIPDPQSEKAFLGSKIHLGLHEHGKHKVLFELYRALIKLRQEISSLSHLSKTGIEVMVYKEIPALMIRRRYGEDRVFGLFNFSEKPGGVRILIEKGVWQKVFDSSLNEWDGPGSSLPESIQSNGSEVYLNLEAYGFVLYRYT
jgi:maltooligosyltrehalose trehalohydrolase